MKIIHQIHGSYDRLNAFERVCVERWNLLNQSWDYRFWTDQDLDPHIEDTWPEHADTYRNMAVVQRAGIQRAFVVWRDGGLYADCDLYPTRRADSFVDVHLPIQMWSYEGREHIAHDYLFFAHPQSDVLRDIIDEAFRRCSTTSPDTTNTDWKSWMFYSAGVHLYTDIANKFRVTLERGCSDNCYEASGHPDLYHCIHFSSENWLPAKRWSGNFERETRDGFDCLNRIKQTHGLSSKW